MDQSGRVVKRYGANTDLEDRKRAEEALHASEHDLRLIIDTREKQNVATQWNDLEL